MSSLITPFILSSYALVKLYSRLCADRLKNLNKHHKKYYRKKHNKVLITVIAVVYSYLSESSAADNSAHGGVAENCRKGNGHI